MRPVERGSSPQTFTNYGDAKPFLIDRMGSFCSYCERLKDAQELHVEHIYPKAATAHPHLERSWRNFLLACSTCNTYKSKHLGNGRQSGLLRRCLWPHIDNTFNAFDYDAQGQMLVSSALGAAEQALAQETITMVGALKSPAVAAKYKDLGIAYDGAKKREEAWAIAREALATYEATPIPAVLTTVAFLCVKSGHFSIWMKVFHRHPTVLAELCRRCSAAAACFDANGAPVRRGRT